MVEVVARADTSDVGDEPSEESVATDDTATRGDVQFLRDRLAVLAARLEAIEQSAQNRKSGVRLSGYADIGAFIPIGNGGVGVKRDIGYAQFPEHSDYAWVFYGDLLGTAVNTRGEAADLGDLPGVQRFDSINSDGNPSFIVNELNLTLTAPLGSKALFTGSVNVTPRTGQAFSLGDWIDVDLAQIEWIPTESGNLSLFVGKIDSVLGIEYKQRKPTTRFGITPSLVARYTTGTALGVKGRVKLFDEHLILATSVTNGSFGAEQFHFYREIDTNAMKTLSGRIATRTHIGSATLEIGASAQVGTQDGAPDGSGLLWFGGADLELSTVSFDLRAQWLVGHAPGDETAQAYGLDLHNGGYVEIDWLFGPVFGITARAELRDADVFLGHDRLYVTRSWRAVGGVRFALSQEVTVKAEYVHNGEYGPVPEFSNDVVTTSVVASY